MVTNTLVRKPREILGNSFISLLSFRYREGIGGGGSVLHAHRFALQFLKQPMRVKKTEVQAIKHNHICDWTIDAC